MSLRMIDLPWVRYAVTRPRVGSVFSLSFSLPFSFSLSCLFSFSSVFSSKSFLHSQMLFSFSVQLLFHVEAHVLLFVTTVRFPFTRF